MFAILFELLTSHPLSVAHFDFSKRGFSSSQSEKLAITERDMQRNSWGWSGGAKVLGKLPVPGRPTDLDYSRARAYCASGRCGGGWTFFLSSITSLFFLPLSGKWTDID